MTTDIPLTDEFTLIELLNVKTIPELKKMAATLGSPVKGSPRKGYIVIALSHLLLKYPEQLVSALFSYELKAYMDAIEGRMTLEYAEKSGLLFELNRFGLLYAVDVKADNSSHLHFCKEIAEVIHPLIRPELERRENDGSLLAEKLALGCANAYGYADLDIIYPYLDRLSEASGLQIANDDFYKAFYPVFSAMSGIKSNKDVFDLLSPFAEYNGFKADADHIDRSIEPADIDFDTVIGFGEMPYPVIRNKVTDKLLRLLEKHGNPEAGTPKEILRQIWIDKQDISINNNLLSSNLNRYFLFSSIEEVSECLGVMTEFLNTIPYWRFRGNSSQEAMRQDLAKHPMKGRMPHIEIGPNLRAMGIESYEQLLEMERRGESFPPFPFPGQSAYTGKKVGRNAPCPCGSGKKFKHCCGK